MSFRVVFFIISTSIRNNPSTFFQNTYTILVRFFFSFFSVISAKLIGNVLLDQTSHGTFEYNYVYELVQIVWKYVYFVLHMALSVNRLPKSVGKKGVGMADTNTFGQKC